MQILQWALDHPDEIERAVLVCATARLTAQNIAFSKVARHAILTHDAMDVARMMAHITYVSEESLRRKFDRERKVPDAAMTLARTSRSSTTSTTRRRSSSSASTRSRTSTCRG